MAVDVSKLRDRVEGSLIALPWSADMLAALIELEQLRAELGHVRALGEASERHRVELIDDLHSLRAAARALVDEANSYQQDRLWEGLRVALRALEEELGKP